MSIIRRLAATALLLAAVTAHCSCRRAPRFGYDFESDDALDQLEWNCLTLYRISTDHATSGTRSLEISFFPAPDGQSDNYPGITFSKFDPDWSRSRALVFDVFNPENVSIRLTLRIDDRKGPAYADRYNRSLSILPGASRVSLPLTDLVTSGAKRSLDRRKIRRVLVFVANPADRHVLFLDRIALE